MLALFLLLNGCAATQPPPTTSQPALQKFEYVRPKMGTGFRIVLYAPDRPAADAAAEAAFARVDELNATLSDYDPKSELSRLSQQNANGPMARPVAVSDDLFRVLEQSQRAAELSGGAFDVTVGPFVRLWRRSRDLRQLPTPQRLADARQSVGFQHVKLDPATRSVALLAPQMRLDVGGIAKGYAADEALAVLRKRGITRAAVGAAGDLAVGDPPPGKDHWFVGIQSLEKPDESAGYVRLRNAAVSTAGDTYRFVEIDGRRYSHIIDPATGLGLTRRTGATVIAPDGMTADWLDTAACILGAERGVELVKQIPGTAVRITTVDGDGPASTRESPGFRGFVVEPGEPTTERTE